MGFGPDGVYVALAQGESFANPTGVVRDLDSNHGWDLPGSVRTLADVNGDGHPDLVGIGPQSVRVSLATASGGFSPSTTVWSTDYTAAAGWNPTRHALLLGDVNGDGKADLVGINDWGIYVSLSNGTSFGPPQLWLRQFSGSVGAWDATRNVRLLADMNNDGLADIVGFGDDNVYVATSDGTRFLPAEMKLAHQFGFIQGWRVGTHIRAIANLNGDAHPDQLSRAMRPGRQIDFTYDEDNHRLLKRVDGVPVRADLPGSVITEDHVLELVTVGGVVVGVLDNGQFSALLTDPRGTPFVGPDGTPGLASPYGVRDAHLAYAEIVDYARLGWDADLDIVRMGVRDYDAKLGQFLTPDPLYLENLERCQTSPLQCSLYGYAAGNPISFLDPTGLGVWSWVTDVASDVGDAAADAARFTVREVMPRAVGVAKVAGGYALAAGGATLCTTGVGGVIGGLGVAYGADVAASGVVQIITGKPTDTQTNRAIASLASQRAADNVELSVAVITTGVALSRSPYLSRLVPKPAAPTIPPRPQYVPRDSDGERLGLPRGKDGQLAPSSPDPHT